MTYDELIRGTEEPMKKHEAIEPKKKKKKFYCPTCGKEIKKGKAYCSGCGQKLDWSTALDTVWLGKEEVFNGNHYIVTEITRDFTAWDLATMNVEMEYKGK